MSLTPLEDLLVAVAAACEGDLDQAEGLLEGALEAAGLPVRDAYDEGELLRVGEALVARGLRAMAKAPGDELAQAGAEAIRALLEALPAEA